MPLADRFYYKTPHPPACTCAGCQEERKNAELGVCPRCHKRSANWIPARNVFQCLEESCGASGPSVRKMKKRNLP